MRSTGTPYPVFLALASLAGIGGGVLSGFMPSTSYFFPNQQGTALGLQRAWATRVSVWCSS